MSLRSSASSIAYAAALHLSRRELGAAGAAAVYFFVNYQMQRWVEECEVVDCVASSQISMIVIHGSQFLNSRGFYGFKGFGVGLNALLL